MNYVAEIVAFEQWVETHYLSQAAQILWYKLMAIDNRSGWQEWVQIDNMRLMSAMGMRREATLVNARNTLIEYGLIEYHSGKKGTPGRYKIFSLANKEVKEKEKRNEAESVVKTVVKSVVKTVVKNEDGKTAENVENTMVEQDDEKQKCDKNMQDEADNVGNNEVESVVKSVVNGVVKTVDIYKLKQNKTYNSLSTCAHAREGDRFADFWQAYPKKVNMLNAHGEYTYALETTETLTEDSLIAAARNYAETCRIRGTHEQYVKYPENWLKESAWIIYLPENYKKPEPPTKGSNKRENVFNSFPQREYDYESLEQKLLGGG